MPKSDCFWCDEKAVIKKLMQRNSCKSICPYCKDLQSHSAYIWKHFKLSKNRKKVYTYSAFYKNPDKN